MLQVIFTVLYANRMTPKLGLYDNLLDLHPYELRKFLLEIRIETNQTKFENQAKFQRGGAQTNYRIGLILV